MELQRPSQRLLPVGHPRAHHLRHRNAVRRHHDRPLGGSHVGSEGVGTPRQQLSAAAVAARRHRRQSVDTRRRQSGRVFGTHARRHLDALRQSFRRRDVAVKQRGFPLSATVRKLLVRGHRRNQRLRTARRLATPDAEPVNIVRPRLLDRAGQRRTSRRVRRLPAPNQRRPRHRRHVPARRLVRPLHPHDNPLQAPAQQARELGLRRHRRRRGQPLRRAGHRGVAAGAHFHHVVVAGSRLGGRHAVRDDVRFVDTLVEDNAVQPHLQHDQLSNNACNDVVQTPRSRPSCIICTKKSKIVKDTLFIDTTGSC